MIVQALLLGTLMMELDVLVAGPDLGSLIQGTQQKLNKVLKWGQVSGCELSKEKKLNSLCLGSLALQNGSASRNTNLKSSYQQ